MKLQVLLLLSATLMISGCNRGEKIDRYSLVNRHNVEISKFDSLNTLTVGNGAFAFSVDITGLQSFPEYYAKGIPLGTMSEWGWNYEKNIGNYDLRDVYKSYNVHGREIEYVHRYSDRGDTLRWAASEYLRRNPYRIHLGVIGLDLDKFTGAQKGTNVKKELFPDENDSNLGIVPEKESFLNRNDSREAMKIISNPHQKLDLWKGEITSRFRINDTAVSIVTICHPEYDMISVRIASDLAASGRLNAKIHFPDGIDSPSGFGMNYPPAHRTSVFSQDQDKLVLRREAGDDYYFVTIYKELSDIVQDNENRWLLCARQGDTIIQFSCLFSKEPVVSNASFPGTRTINQSAWENFWMTGGAVDFSGSTDPRASELERRVVLSRYLTKIQCSGSYPPAETGLTFNSWYGKFHLEMHWWHAVHFAMWQNEDILAKQMEYYNSIFEKALYTARKQGYAGVRWPKMTDPAGNESPSGVGTYLIWQQPHFIYFAELLYQNSKDKKSVLEKYSRLVFSTADFMASYAWYDSTHNRYSLGPVLISAQESLKLETTVNPTFELVYWYWGLRTALEWQKRMGEGVNKKWKEVTDKISPLPVMGNLYLCSEDTEDTWTNPRYMSDHPIISGIKGMMPETPLVDDRLLGNSLDTIVQKWNWRSCWGWDFPMLAISAASIGRSDQAIDFLMMDAQKNRYLDNGHNFQDGRLTIYLPGNGGLLSAVAMMCTSDRFPKNGKWKVRWENLNPILR